MNYACVHIEKLKTQSEMVYRHNHNSRKTGFAPNADPRLANENVWLIGTPEQTYYGEYKKTIKELPYYETHSVRKNAVLGCEIMLNFSPEMTGKIDLNQWCKANVEWLTETFGQKNVKSAVLHMDESTPHIHAFVTPVDRETGKLNYSHYVDGRKDLERMNDTYAQKMKQFGLTRGIRRTGITHQTIRDTHNMLQDYVQSALPHVTPGESAEDYRKRAEQEYKKIYAKEAYYEIEHHRRGKIEKDLQKKDEKIEELESEVKTLNLNMEQMRSINQRLQDDVRSMRNKDRAIERGFQLHPDGARLRSEYISMQHIMYTSGAENLGFDRTEELEHGELQN